MLGPPPVADPDDFLSEEFLADPFPLYRYYREQDPVHWNARLKAWMLFRHADVLSVATDLEHFASKRTAQFMSSLQEVGSLDLLARLRGSMPLYLDPPQHTRLRSQVNRSLTPRAAQQLRAGVQSSVDRLLDQVMDAGRMDVIRDLAAPLPAMTNARVMGLPETDGERLKRWTADFLSALSGGGLALPAEVLQRGQRATSDMVDYLAEAVESRRRHPRDDLLTRLVAARDAGGLDSDDELFGICINILFAGFETVSNLIGNGLLAMLRHPDQLALLRSQPALLVSAVEEMLRYDCPIPWASRVARCDVDLHGRPIRKGQLVFLGFAPANRDPAQFADPERFDITRTGGRHLTFSHGIHYCPGAGLARMQGEVVFSTLLRRMSCIDLEPRPFVWQRNMSFHGLATMGVSFVASASG